MATPTSHPRPSPQKSHLTPTASGLSPPPPSSTHSQASKKPLHYRNGSLQHGQPSPSATPSGGAGGIAMSRSGTTNGTIGGTPMVRSGTNTSSVGKTPVLVRAGRGMSASTTSAAASPSLTAAANMIIQSGTGLTPQGGLGLGLTPLGMGSGGLAQGFAGLSRAEQEEERKRRLDIIKEMIGTRAAGLVGQEGVERAARKAGLECLWEDGMGSDGKRVLSIAGSGLLIEVDFQQDWVVAVGLSFPASREGEDGVGKWAHKGSEVLKEDLTGYHETKGYVGLGKFAANLERLAKMDQLGGDDISCFDAVDGIFKSLKRIQQWEVKKVSEKGENKNLRAEDAVMCNYSGRPAMHAERNVGLGVQYWKDQRLVTRGDENDIDKMDIDNKMTDTADGSPEEKSMLPPWTIMIECEAWSAQLYDNIKLSDQWVSNAVERSPAQELDALHISTSQIDWLNVKDSGFPDGKNPDIRFVAKFDPPVIVPLQLAMQIHQSLDSPVDQTTVLPATYETLLLADVDARNSLPNSTTPTNPRTAEQMLTIPPAPTLPSSGPSSNSSKPQKAKATFTLFNQSQDFALALTQLPFKHPIQIINLLPTLRQWVLVGTLLRRCFTPSITNEHEELSTKSRNAGPKVANCDSTSYPLPPNPPKFQTLQEELDEFLASPSSTITNKNNLPHSSDANTAIEISFITSPLPRFTIHFQNPRYAGKLASVALSIGLNGTFEGVEVDDGRPPLPPPAADTDGGEETARAILQLREKVRTVLEVSESIGVVVEWLCRS